MQVSTAEFKKGLKIQFDGEPYAPVGDNPEPGPLTGGQIVVHLPSREELSSSDG